MLIDTYLDRNFSLSPSPRARTLLHWWVIYRYGFQATFNGLKLVIDFNAQGPHPQILMMGGGGVRQKFIFNFIPKKNYNFRICLPKKKITTFFSIPPKKPLVLFSQPPKNPPFFFGTQKIPASFKDPKKSPLVKISDPKKSLGPPPPPPPPAVIKICEWGTQSFNVILFWSCVWLWTKL